MSKRKTAQEFISEAKQIHGEKYSYDKVIYVNNHTKVCITCPEHGDFWQFPQDHIKGRGCSACAGVKKLTTEDFIKKAKDVHGNKFDYSKVVYKGNEEPVCIICPKHGEFWQTPHAHLSGCDCPKCRYTNAWDSRGRITNEQFIKKAIKVHGDKYDYSKVIYKNTRTKICIICPKHGEFWQTPSQHLKGDGCPICEESHMEKEIRIFLSEHKIKYEYEKHFDGLGGKSYDFYLPELNIAIECQGVQHFEPIEFFGGKVSFEKRKENDRIKRVFCKNNGIKLLEVTERTLLKYNKNMLTVNQCKTLLELFNRTSKGNV